MDRNPAVAGRFYPHQAVELGAVVDRLLEAAPDAPAAPKALLAPHAGYIYSGALAAQAFARIRPAAQRIRRVVLLGPAHHLPVGRIGASSARAFATPLGRVPLAVDAIEQLQLDGQVEYRDDAHAPEHCLEVELPFLQRCLGEFELLPLLVGGASPEAVEELLETVWGGDETLIVVSSDLSHYHDYDTACRLDAETAQAIRDLDWQQLESRRACGFRPLQGLLRAARRRGMQASQIGLCNSGDTAGPRDRVVGYAAHAFH